MKNKSLVVPALLLATALSAAGCGGNDTTSTPDMTTPAAAKDIVATASGAANLTTLVAAVKAADLVTTLQGAGPFTVFAPTDTAFSKIDPSITGKLLTAPYKTELALILKYHVIAGDVKAAAILGKTLDQATAAPGGAKLKIDGSDGKTVVINGGVKVATADVAASNGTVHIVDGVLLPTIVDTAKGYDDGTTKFSTLVSAVVAADLAGLLSGPGTFTVFAPSDAAFAKLKTALGDAAYNAILADKAKLARILKYHVLTAQVLAKDVASGAVATAAGANDKITLTVGAGKVTIADSTATAANVVFTDVPNSNGVIHVIDKVLIPANL